MTTVETQPPQQQPPRMSGGRRAAIVVGIAVLIALAWLFRERGGFLWLGLATGVLILGQVAVVVDALEPVGDLLDALRPLALPLVLVVAAGTVDSPLPLQLFAGTAAMLVGWHLLIRREVQDPRQTLSGILRATGRDLVKLGAAAASIAVIVVLQGPGAEEAIAGGPAGWFFFVAVVLFVAATVLRLAGYGSSPLRAVIALLVLAAAVRVTVQIGLVPGYDAVQDIGWLSAKSLLALAAAGVVVAGILEVLLDTDRIPVGLAGGARKLARWWEESRAGRNQSQWRRWGLHAAVYSTLALFVAMVLAANPGQATGALAGELRPAPPGPAVDRPVLMSDDALARAYAPVLLFSARQPWSPTSADAYLSRAKMTDWKGQPQPISKLDSGSDCSRHLVACYTLTIACSDGGDECAMGRKHEPGERVTDGVAYVRVARRAKPADDGSPDPFQGVGPYGSRATILVQYWFFYPYDEWTSPVVAGRLKQHHEADWEAVTIGFDDDGPLFMGFSQHCGGQWYPWNQVRVDRGTSQLRPLVAVADGSQANYRYPNPSEAPDWTGCANLPARTLTLVSYASNIRDQTGVDWSWQAERYVRVDATSVPMRYVADWAPYSRTEFVAPWHEQRLGPDARGPATPTLQNLWREPMRTMFGKGQWRRGKTS